MSATVVRTGDGFEALLAGRVPLGRRRPHTNKHGESAYDLELDSASLELNGADFKVDTNGADKGLIVRVVSKAEQQTRLAHPRVAN